jgi:hypothetical protein
MTRPTAPTATDKTPTGLRALLARLLKRRPPVWVHE